MFIPPTAPAPAAHEQARYGFAGVEMGAAPEALRLRFANAACSRAQDGASECVVQDQPLGGGYFARDLTYRFVGDRLAEIRFHSSVDGFAFVTAKLEQAFGRPADIRRDQIRLYGHPLPHVAWRWRNGRAVIELSDPAAPGQLAVRIALDSKPPQPAAS